MAILINDTTPRSQYTATSGQTVFSIPFEFFSNSDIAVYQNAVLKTLTTHYTLTGAGVTGGGSLTLVTGATVGDVITIVRDIPVKRVTDFPTSGPFNIDALNTDLDRLTAMVQERENQVSRVISLAQTDAAVNLYLPTAANRASKVMAFDNTGNVIVSQELGQYRGNWASGTAYVLRDIIKDTSNANIYICVAAHTSTGSQPISSNANSASWALLVDAATATTASASASSSASAASSSASAASSSASAASSSASSASSSASSATSSASTATTQASNASTSATNAASSASSASTSATNASNSATSASNSAAAAAATIASGLYSSVIDKSANYTVALADAGDLIRVTTTSGAVTITLPQISTVTDGFKVAIVKWSSDTNAVNIVRSGSNTINGTTSSSIGLQYNQTTFVADFETNQWFASTSGLGSTNVVIDTFNGTGSQTAFTLSGDPSTKNNTSVYVSGVYQAKTTYSLSTTTLTFSTAPPSGTANIEVVWTQPLLVGTPNDGTVTDIKISSSSKLYNRINDTVSVKDYGAVGDGTTNDTAAMQAAHNTGKTVYYPAGSYKFTSITMATGGIIGDGPQQTIFYPSGTTGDVIVCSSAPDAIGPVFQNFQIQPLNVMTSGTLLTIKCSNTANVTTYAYVNNVLFFQNYFAGLLMQNSIQYSVSNCHFINYSDAGFTSEDLANPDAGDATIYGCVFNTARTSGNRNGLVWKSGGGLRINNNKFLGGQSGILGLISYNTAAADLYIVGNSIENMAYAGIYLARAGGYTGTFGGVYIHNNNIGNDVYNIYSSNVGYTTFNIAGNTFYTIKNNTVHIGLDGTDNSLITSNVFDASSGLTGVNGIAIGSSNTYCRVTGNLYRRVNTPYTNASATTIVDEHRQFGSNSAATSIAYGSLYLGQVVVTFAVPFYTAPMVTATLKDVSGLGGVSVVVSGVSTTGFTAQVIGVTNSVTLPFNWNASGVISV